MVPVLSALAPVAALIALGWALRKGGLLGEAFWPSLDRLIYTLLLPAMLIQTLANTAPSEFPPGRLMFAGCALLLGMSGLAIMLRWRRVLDHDNFPALLQGVIRINLYVGLAAGEALYGRPGLLALTLVAAVTVPLDNVISVLALVRERGRHMSWSTVLAYALRNPIILSVAIGSALSFAQIRPPVVLSSVLALLAAAALPLAMISVGAALRFGFVARGWNVILLGAAGRLVAMPLFAIIAAAAWGLSGVERATLLLYAALPTGPAAYAVTRQLGGNAELMAAIIAVTTLLSALTLPFWLLVAG